MKSKRPRGLLTSKLLSALLADPDAPLPLAKRTYHLTIMWQGLAALERAPEPTLDDWRVCSDAINFMETLVLTLKVAEDRQGLLGDAVAALAAAGRRYRQGMALRLDAAGMQSVRAVLEDYASLLEALPERVVVRAHQITEQRVREIQAGRRQAHDVEVMAL